MDQDQTAAHCAERVKQGHRPRFIAALFATPEQRRRLFALYAFDEDLLHIRTAAREPMIVAMRFQWWRDAVGRLPDYPVGHPVLTELAKAGLSNEALARFVDAREADDASAQAETQAVSLAATICGASTGANDIADAAGAAIALQNGKALATARKAWAVASRTRKSELPAYLPATVVDMRHPVTPLRLYSRILLMALRNRF